MTGHDDDIIDPDERDLPLEPRLAEAARAYNPPPVTPREAMWERIAAARLAAGAEAPRAPAAPAVAPVVAPDTRVVSIDAARARRRPVRTWAVLAGTLAAGIALGVFGRDVFRDDAIGSGGTPVVARVDTARPATPAVDTGARLVVNEDPKPVLTGGTGKPPVGPIAPQRGPSSGTGMVATRGGGTPPETNSVRDRERSVTLRPHPEAPRRDQYADRGTGAERGGSTLYHAAAVQTLSQAEALLVAWRVDAPRDTAAARQLGTWARDVLGSTRLLLDSPAASDTRLRALLDDLELVLAQIVQLSGAPLTEEERALLERSVRARDLLPRIRSAVPAGSTGSATSI